MLDLLPKLFPVYSYILVGFLARRYLGISQHYVAQILFYLCIPLIVFKSTMSFTSETFFLLSALSFLVSCLMSLCAQWLTPRFCTVLTPGICQCLYGYFNIAWFGIPMVYVLYGSAAVITMIPFYIGGMLFGNTMGYLLVTQSTFNIASPLVAIKKLATIPALYAFLAGLAINNNGWSDHLNTLPLVSSLFHLATITTSIFGMGLVGMSVADIKISTVRWPQVFRLLYLRFICAIVIVGVVGTIAWKINYLSLLEFKIFLLFPLLPIAANILVFADQTSNDNSTLGMAIIISTILSCLLFLGGTYLMRAIDHLFIILGPL